LGNNEYLYEGKRKHGVHGVDGVITLSGNEPTVVMYSAGRDSKLIKAGEQIGTVSTMVELESESEEDEPCTNWTLDDLDRKAKIGEDLDDRQKTLVCETILKFQEALSRDDSDIGRALVTPHVIELTNNTPIWQRARTFSEPVNREIDRQCKELLSQDIIEYSNSQWSSPVVPVRKKDGSLRMCVDYRALNRVTKTEKFPMPNITESVYAGHAMRYFTKLDLVKGYYQVPIDEASRQFTAFGTPHNHFQFKRLSFGMKNGAIVFQKNLQQILSDFCFNNVIVYIDDILILTETFEEHLELVGKILKTLQKYGIKIKVEKCNFFVREVTFLGHVLSSEGVRKSPDFTAKNI